jgi:hypothetical protein
MDETAPRIRIERKAPREEFGFTTICQLWRRTGKGNRKPSSLAFGSA